ncbi:MAG: carbonic anhydrase [Cyanobacteria bacterium J06639_1]
MRKLIRGIDQFQHDYVATHHDLLEQLSHGQKPRVLFITCSDSRVAPNLITQTDIGDLFVIRNAGNIIPPYGAANGGEGGTVEYAIQALGIEQVIVCGHSHCGAMKGLLKLDKLSEEMPLVRDWLRHAESTRRLVRENYPDYEGEELIEILVAENVLIQMDNLKTYPVVRARLNQGKLQIFGWIYHIETGEVLAFDPSSHAFIPPHNLPIDRLPLGRPRVREFPTQSEVLQTDSVALSALKSQLEAIVARNPKTWQEADEAMRALSSALDRSLQAGMTPLEAQAYQQRFSEQIPAWMREILTHTY